MATHFNIMQNVQKPLPSATSTPPPGIGSIIARDVRHLHPGSARYRAKMAHIPGRHEKTALQSPEITNKPAA